MSETTSRVPLFSCHDWRRFPTSEWATFFASLQPGYIQHGPTLEPSDYMKPLYDIELRIPESDTELWSFQRAVDFCEARLSWAQSEGEDQYNHLVFLNNLLELEGAELAPFCLDPNRKISAPIVVPVRSLDEAVTKSNCDVGTYYMLWHAGIEAMKSNSLDHLPHAFHKWFSDAVSGNISANSARPRSWRVLTRDSVIEIALSEMRRHGIHPTRARSSPKVSGCDAIVEAALRLRLDAPRSYETVEKLFQKFTYARKKRVSQSESKSGK